MNTITKRIALSIVMLSSACQAFGVQPLSSVLEAHYGAQAAAQTTPGYFETVKSYVPSISVPSMDTVKSYISSVSMPSQDAVVTFVTENATKKNGVIAAGVVAALGTTVYLYKKGMLSVPSMNLTKRFVKESTSNGELIKVLKDARENGVDNKTQAYALAGEDTQLINLINKYYRALASRKSTREQERNQAFEAITNYLNK